MHQKVITTLASPLNTGEYSDPGCLPRLWHKGAKSHIIQGGKASGGHDVQLGCRGKSKVHSGSLPDKHGERRLQIKYATAQPGLGAYVIMPNIVRTTAGEGHSAKCSV
jgi:hypothetical protein